MFPLVLRGICVWSLCGCAALNVVSSFAGEEKAGCITLTAFGCIVTFSVLRLFLTVLLIGMQW